MLNPFGKDPAKYQGHVGDSVSIGIILEHSLEADLVFWRDLNLPGYAKCITNGENISWPGVIDYISGIQIDWFAPITICIGQRRRLISKYNSSTQFELLVFY